MNDSFLYHAFGIQEMHCRKTEYKGNTIIMTLQARERICKCPDCGSRNIVKNGTKTRDFTGLPIGGKKTIFRCVLQRYKCKEEGCGFDRQQEISFAKGSCSYIKRLVPYVVDLLKIGTIKDVAAKLDVGWDMIKDIHKEYLQARYGRPSLKGVTRIGIDEFAVRKGHVYKTIVVDLDTGRILHVGDGKGVESLKNFWKRVKRNKIDIKVVTIDMSAAFYSSVIENIPKAVVVFDHFHVVKLMNDALDKVRRQAYREAKTKDDAKLIKGTRWLLMSNAEDLEDRQKLDKALEANDSLYKAYYLKEDLRLIWSQINKVEAEKKLLEWVEMMRATEIKPLVKVANTVMSFRTGILSWYDHRISNSKVEGLNNKIKVLKRVAYGFRDEDYFRLRLFALHDARITRNVG